MPLYVTDKKIPIEVPRQEWQDESSLLIRLDTVRSQDQRFDFEELNRLDERLSFTPWHASDVNLARNKGWQLPAEVMSRNHQI